MKIDGGRRLALLQAANDSEYVNEVYGGYLHVYIAAFGEEGDRWDLFRVYDGEFPDLNEIQYYDGFVVTGSPHNAFGNEKWILNLCLLLQTLDAMEKKVLGICFGHQVICRALGGKVGRSCSGWDIGIREVRLVKEFAPEYMQVDDMDDLPASLSIIEIHQDEVFEVPFDAEVIAFSGKTGVEMFTVGDHILGIQGHPEYTKDILTNLVDRLLSMDMIEKSYAHEVKCRLQLAEPDRKCWERICKKFLRGT